MTTDRPEVSDALDLVARVETHLSAVEAAMQRVDNGEYGRCEACGAEIDAGELEADPARKRCAEHQDSERPVAVLSPDEHFSFRGEQIQGSTDD